jgi:hypothetical protein
MIGKFDPDTAPHPAIKAHTINDAAAARAILTGDGTSIFFLTGVFRDDPPTLSGDCRLRWQSKITGKVLNVRNKWDQTCAGRPR